MKKERPSLQDIRRARGEDLDAIIQRDEMNLFGCVIRAIESITGKPATRQEKAERLTFIKSCPTAIDLAIETRGDVVQFQRRKAEVEREDETWIKAFLKRLSSADTPIGEVLRGCEFVSTKMDSAQIEQTLKDGGELLLATSRHMCHPVIKEDKLISQSDEGRPLVLGKRLYSVLIKRSKI